MSLLIIPAALVVLGLLAAPVLILFRISLNDFSPTQLMQEAFTAENYVRAFADPYYREILATTVGVALACTLIALLLAFPAAYRLARMQSKWKSVATILTLFPLLVGNVVRSAGWMALIGNEGLLNAAMRGLGIVSAPVQMMYTVGAVIAGTVAVVLPFMVLTLAAVIESIPHNAEEAAANLGAPPGTVFRRVVWPLAMPGVIGGSILVFILCMNAYATPVLLGGPRFRMMAPAVYQQFIASSNWPFGAALAFILLAATLVLTVTTSVGLARRYAVRLTLWLPCAFDPGASQARRVAPPWVHPKASSATQPAERQAEPEGSPAAPAWPRCAALVWIATPRTSRLARRALPGSHRVAIALTGPRVHRHSHWPTSVTEPVPSGM